MNNPPNGVNKWVYAIEIYGTDVYVGGNFTKAGGNPASHVAKWNGSIWSALGGGTDTNVRALKVNLSTGKMIVGGMFTQVDGSISANNIATFTDSDNPLPVELTSFTANVFDSKIQLNWRTSVEVNNYGFEIEKHELRNENFGWRKLGFVFGHGNSNSPNSYTFVDQVPKGNKIFYRLKQINSDGSYTYSSEIEVDFSKQPSEFQLAQNYPNPFNPFTTIKFTVPLNGKVLLEVYNLMGEKIETLVDDERKAGNYIVEFNAENLSSGTYFYRLNAIDFVQTRKFLLIK